MDYTIYQNSSDVWCINHLDPTTNKRVRKSLKTKKKSEALKKARDYFDNFTQNLNAAPLFQDYASLFYTDACPWTQRRRSFGRGIKLQTQQRYRWYLENRIMPWFKDYRMDEITDKTVFDFALSLKNDGTTKNDIVSLVRHIIDEAVLDQHRTHGIQTMRFPKSKSSQEASLVKLFRSFGLMIWMKCMPFGITRL